MFHTKHGAEESRAESGVIAVGQEEADQESNPATVYQLHPRPAQERRGLREGPEGEVVALTRPLAELTQRQDQFLLLCGRDRNSSEIYVKVTVCCGFFSRVREGERERARHTELERRHAQLLLCGQETNPNVMYMKVMVVVIFLAVYE